MTFCILPTSGEPGEFVGKIVKNHPSRGFDGYVDQRATEKKIVRDVLRKGDMWFRSGDLLTMDEFGNMYFVDRLGDTFRYVKSRNFVHHVAFYKLYAFVSDGGEKTSPLWKSKVQ